MPWRAMIYITTCGAIIDSMTGRAIIDPITVGAKIDTTSIGAIIDYATCGKIKNHVTCGTIIEYATFCAIIDPDRCCNNCCNWKWNLLHNFPGVTVCLLQPLISYKTLTRVQSLPFKTVSKLLGCIGDWKSIKIRRGTGQRTFLIILCRVAKSGYLGIISRHFQIVAI